jgi:serine/threonine protein kinase
VGTPGYIAPEHFEGRTSDARSDQFSYAAAVFRALTGVNAYPAESLAAYRLAVQKQQRTAWPRFVPRAVKRVVDRGLALQPEKRYRELGELVDKLEQAAQPSRRGVKVAVAGTIAAGLARRASTPMFPGSWYCAKWSAAPARVHVAGS